MFLKNLCSSLRFGPKIIGSLVVDFFDQLVFKLGVVLDDTVVDHGELAAGGAVGVGVAVAGFAMGSPAGVADPGVCVEVFSDEALFEFGYFSFFLVDLQFIVQKSDAGTVISPVFEAFKAF